MTWDEFKELVESELEFKGFDGSIIINRIDIGCDEPYRYFNDEENKLEIAG